MEEKTHRIYSGDFRISMINLSHIENATKEDRESGLYDWVRLFMATEWKELMEMAQQSETLGQAIVTLAELSEEEQIRQQCAARRKYEMDEQARAKYMKRILDESLQKVAEAEEKVSQAEQKASQAEQKASQAEQKASQAKQELFQMKQKTFLLTKLTSVLIKAGRADELERVLEDENYFLALLQELNIETN